MITDVDIPKRALFKAAEVCSIAGVQPYVLSSWEAEFAGLGRSKKRDGTRVYRRAEVELVLRIKHLVFVDGLTLGAARRQLQGEQEAGEPQGEESLEDLLGKDVRERMVEVKRGLQAILELLSNGHGQPTRVEPAAIGEAWRSVAAKRPATRKPVRPGRSREAGNGKRRGVR